VSRDPRRLCQIIQSALPAILDDFAAFDPTRKLIIVETDRSTEKQQQDYAQGRSQRDGVHLLSMHQVQELHGEMAAHAVDFGVIVRGKYATDRGSYEPLMVIVERHGLRSGMDWDGNGVMDVKQNPKAFVDGPHAECHGNTLTGVVDRTRVVRA
jgi:hypothetical protein